MNKKKVLLTTLILVSILVLTFACKGGGGGPKIKKTPAGFKTYTDDQNNFKLAYPEEWKLTAFKDKGGCTISPKTAGALFVKTRKAGENETLSKRTQNFENRFKLWKKDQFTMHEDKSTTLSGYDAHKFIYTMKGYATKTQYLIYTVATGRYYEIIFDGSDEAYNKIKDKIQTVVDTFHITK